MSQSINVQFSDSTEQTIAAYFGSPQDPATYKNLGTVTTDDARWKTYYNSVPWSMQNGMPAPTGA